MGRYPRTPSQSSRPSSADEQRLDEKDPHERADECRDLPLHGDPDRDAEQQPEQDAEHDLRRAPRNLAVSR